MKIFVPKEKDIPLCAEVYISAYKAEPWNEAYEKNEVENMFRNIFIQKQKFVLPPKKKAK